MQNDEKFRDDFANELKEDCRIILRNNKERSLLRELK